MSTLQKRIMVLCLSFLLVIMTFPSTVFAMGEGANDTSDEDDPYGMYHGYCGGDLKWNYDQDGTLTISGTGTMYDYMQYEPTKDDLMFNLENLELTPWSYCDVKKIVIQEGATTIGIGAFARCKVEEVSIPDTVTKIGSVAFYQCGSLKNVTIPNSVKSIGTAAFAYSGLESVTIPDSVSTMGPDVFMGCGSMKKATLSKQLTEIPEGAFAQCGFEKIEIPENIRYIRSAAYNWCDKLKEAVIPGTVYDIAEDAFLNCDRDLTICGVVGSCAQDYARTMGFNFVSNEKFKVTFEDYDGRVISEQMVTYGQAAVAPQDPTRESDEYYTYQFSWWSEDYSCVTSDLVVVAQYNEIPREYTVTFDANGGTSSDAKTLTVEYGTKLGTLPVCTRKGYKFKGWFTAPKKGEKVTEDTEVMSDMALYAQWKKK